MPTSKLTQCRLQVTYLLEWNCSTLSRLLFSCWVYVKYSYQECGSFTTRAAHCCDANRSGQRSPHKHYIYRSQVKVIVWFSDCLSVVASVQRCAAVVATHGVDPVLSGNTRAVQQSWSCFDEGRHHQTQHQSPDTYTGAKSFHHSMSTIQPACWHCVPYRFTYYYYFRFCHSIWWCWYLYCWGLGYIS